MKTTFASTYDATAKELQKNATPEPTFTPIVSCTTTYTDFLPTTRPSRRRRKERPKTTLRVGGEGSYRTVNRDSFKNFVVVTDDNNNEPENLAMERNYAEAKHVAVIDSENHQSPSEAEPNPDPSIVHIMSQQPDDVTHLTLESSLQTDRKEDEPCDDKTRTSHVENPDAIAEMTSDDPRNGKSDTEQGAQKRVPENADTEAVVRQKRVTQSRIGVGSETLLPRSQSGSFRADESRGRSAQKKESRSRHLSHPRSKHKHKNESQLRFDGAMDFETTTRRLYQSCEEKAERDGSRKRVTRARDLFKPSDEVDLFHSHRTDKFDGSTTYSLCFQNRQYCPALDLNTNQSDYIFRAKTGSHNYYSGVNKLS